MVEAVGEKKVLTDGTHVVELHHLQNFTHHDGMLVAYLPEGESAARGRWLQSAAGDGDAAESAEPVYTSSLLDNIQRLKLDVQRIVPVHYPADNRVVTMAELARWVGRTPSTQ